MILLSSAQILLRNFFDSGIDWADPLLRLLVLWVGMQGAMLATHYDKHIRIDLVSRFIPEQYHRLSGFLTALVRTAAKPSSACRPGLPSPSCPSAFQ